MSTVTQLTRSIAGFPTQVHSDRTPERVRWAWGKGGKEGENSE